MPRFTIRELSKGGFVLMDGGHTMEDLEVEAERLNLGDRIACALETIAAHYKVVGVPVRPGDVCRQKRRADLEEAIGRAEALAARQKARLACGDFDAEDKFPSSVTRAKLKTWADTEDARVASLRAQLEAFEAGEVQP